MEGDSELDKPVLVVVDRVGQLPSGSRYVLTYVEFWKGQTVIRILGLNAGVGREIRQLRLALRDDGGREYAWTATTSGGTVLPEEVCLGFEGVPADVVRRLTLVEQGGAVLQEVEITPAP